MSIELRHVSKKFDQFQALDDVSLKVPPGRLTALLGPSGGGKSTLLRVIAGLEFADEGMVLIDGLDVADVPARKRGIGFVFQHYAAFPHMTVWHNVAFGLEIAKTPKDIISQRVNEMLELVHLHGLANRFPHELSGGQRQRMALARALAVKPQYLLLDEPFGAVDARVRKELRTWLRNLHDEVHTTTLFVTHDQEEALEISDEIVVVNDGRIEQVGTPQELYDQPNNEFVMEFMGPVTRLNNQLLRPHDVQIRRRKDRKDVHATVKRIVSLGFHLRVDLLLADHALVTAQISRDQAKHLTLVVGDQVYLRPRETDSTGRHLWVPSQHESTTTSPKTSGGEGS